MRTDKEEYECSEARLSVYASLLEFVYTLQRSEGDKSPDDRIGDGSIATLDRVGAWAIQAEQREQSILSSCVRALKNPAPLPARPGTLEYEIEMAKRQQPYKGYRA